MSRLSPVIFWLFSLLALNAAPLAHAKGKAPATPPQKTEASPADQALLDMEQAFLKLDSKRLKTLLQLSKHQFYRLYPLKLTI